MKKILTLLFTLFVLVFTTQAQLVGNWTLLGPIPFPLNDVGQINGIGRISQVKFHPTISTKMYAVSGWGGLFISTNTGTSWTKTGTDKYYYGHTASCAVDYTNDNILYLGTGDANYYYDGSGVWKSTDAGTTWTQSNSGMGNRLVLEILVSPADNNILLAATNNGIYRSTNAGATWTLRTAAGINFQDMVFKPGSNGATVYATARQAFYRSTDNGVTWTQITSGAFIFGANGTRVAVCPASPNVVYVGNVGANCLGEIYKSTDGGTTFANVRTETTNTLTAYDWNNANGWGGQGNYNFDIDVDPTNANNVWLCSHIVWKSTNGGANWTNVQASWAYVLHTDQHQIIVNPYNTAQLFNVNDGGVWLSTNGGVNWTTRSDGLATTESYHASTSPIRKDMVSIATQDNGELYYASGAWHCNGGGDFTKRSAFDYNTAQNNRVYYIDEGNNGNKRVLPTNGRQTLNYPFTPNESWGNSDTRFAFSRLNINRAYVSQNDVYVSNNILSNPPAWTQVTFANVRIQDVEPSPANSATVFAMRNDNIIVRIDNAYTTPTVTTYAFPSGTGTQGLVAPTRNNPSVIYATGGQRVYRSADNGATWTNVTANLPATNILHIIHDEYSTDESMYVNMGYSVWYKNNTMANWVNFSQNLPVITYINEMMIFNDGTSNSVLRVAFFGRGVWETPLYPWALPCDLISFYAERQSDITQVTWLTANERDVKSFDLQRSTDGVTWKTIYTTPPHGGTMTTRYDFDDADPLTQITYYRLITKDLDGKEGTSKTISVAPDDQTSLILYPNPVVDQLNLHLKNSKGTDVQVEVYNYKGQLLYKETHQSNDIQVNTSTFISGYYVVKVTTQEYSKSQGFLIMK